MELSEKKKTVLKRLTTLVEEGSALRDEIEAEYRNKRGVKTFDQGRDLPVWEQRHAKWRDGCIAGIEDLFEPAIIVLNKFKNPKMDGLYPSGENIAWSSLDKTFNAELEFLGDLYERIAAIADKEFSEYFDLEVSTGIGKIKVGKIIRKWLDR